MSGNSKDKYYNLLKKSFYNKIHGGCKNSDVLEVAIIHIDQKQSILVNNVIIILN